MESASEADTKPTGFSTNAVPWMTSWTTGGNSPFLGKSGSFPLSLDQSKHIPLISCSPNHKTPSELYKPNSNLSFRIFLPV